jgi:hypothetical protein
MAWLARNLSALSSYVVRLVVLVKVRKNKRDNNNNNNGAGGNVAVAAQ